MLREGTGIAQSVQQLATDWVAEGTDFESRKGQDFSLLHVVHTGSAAHPACYPMGTGASFSWGEADHSPPSSAEVENTMVYTSTSPYTFKALCLIS
jgi:hypothetical protein